MLPSPPAPTLLALLLAALAMLGPFAVDTYLPAFPAMGSGLNATPLQIQQTLSIYMLSFAGMILWHGALADTFGRRRVILWALVVFSLASVGCMLATSIEMLWFMRALQGTSAGAGIVIGRAIVRDLHAGAQAEKLLALVSMIFSIGPAIAPIIGGWILKLTHWRVIFGFLALYAVGLLWLCIKRLPESLPPEKRHRFNPQFLWTSYRRVFSTRAFHFKAAVIAFNFAGLFLYVASAPAVVTEHLGLGPDQFGWLFVPSVSGIFLGSLAANRMAGKATIERQVAIGFGFLVFACLFNLGYHLFFPPRLPFTVAPLFFYTIGMSMVMPGVTLMLLDLFPDIRGVIASCQSFTMTLLAAVVAGAVSPLLSPSVAWLAGGQAAFVGISLACWSLRERARD